MSLVLTLAWRNLFQDRLRFVASLMGIVVSVVLVMVQMGLYLGFSGMITTMIDHASTDLWIISTGAKYFEDLSLLNTRMRDQLIAVDGVSEVIPAVVGFSAWSLPDGAMTSVVVVGTDVAAGGLVPWNVVEGTATSLSTPGTVAIDRSYYDRLGVSGVAQPARFVPCQSPLEPSRTAFARSRRRPMCSPMCAARGPTSGCRPALPLIFW